MEKNIKDLDIYLSDGNYSAKYPRSEEFVDEGIPFIRGNNMVDGDIIDDEMYHITPEKHAILLKGHVKAGDVLITTRGNIGQVAIVPKRHEDSNINAQIVLLRTNPDSLYNRYLLWALQSQRAKEQYLALQTGTALKQLPVGKLEKLAIKIIDIKEQHEIADVLDKTYEVIKSRRTELQLLDDLIKARFIEMFGTITKTKYPVHKLSDYAQIKHGYAFKGEYFSEEDNGILLVTPGNFSIGGGFQYKKCKFFTSEYPEKYVLHPGDLIVTMTDLSKASDTLGNAAIVPDDGYVYLHNQRIGLFEQLDEAIDKTYLEFYMRTDDYRAHILSGAAGSTVKHTSPTKILEAKFILPPVEEQRAFAELKMQSDKSKVVVQKALDEAQLLFDSLMQKYFG